MGRCVGDRATSDQPGGDRSEDATIDSTSMAGALFPPRNKEMNFEYGARVCARCETRTGRDPMQTGPKLDQRQA